MGFGIRFKNPPRCDLGKNHGAKGIAGRTFQSFPVQPRAFQSILVQPSLFWSSSVRSGPTQEKSVRVQPCPFRSSPGLSCHLSLFLAVPSVLGQSNLFQSIPVCSRELQVTPVSARFSSDYETIGNREAGEALCPTSEQTVGLHSPMPCSRAGTQSEYSTVRGWQG